MSQKEERRDTYRSVRDERRYGPYWYSGLWIVLRPLLVGLTVAVIILGLGVTVWNRVYENYLSPADKNDLTEIPFEVSSGQSLTRVARNLEEAGLIRSGTFFKYYCDFAGMGQKIQIGAYRLNRGMTMAEIADQLTTGDGNPIVRNITLIPGENVEEFAAKMKEAGVLEDTAVFLDLCRTGTAFRDYYYIADLLADGSAGKRKYALEGYLAANTYEVYTTATEEEIIRKLLSQTEALFPEELQQEAEAQGLGMNEILTLASLIEKEAKTADFAKVSAVFRNRLKAGMPLESDVTIHYLTGVPKMALSEADLKVDSPYNTYRVKGLPPGPICSPSPAAVLAALRPDQTYLAENYLFFCARDPGSGELYFSRSLQEHEQAVALYVESWKDYDKSRGIE